MEALVSKPQPSVKHRLLPAVVPVLFIAVTHVDPGKWVAAVEGGARFGYDLIVLMFVFSLAAVLCQYLSACIAVVTGKDLAQICSAEYDTMTCVFLGVQAEISVIASDLSMILGIAHGLNLTFGISLFTSVFLTSLDAFLFPLFSSFLETSKAKFLCVCLATVALLSYLFGVLVSQPDTSLSMGGMLTKFSGESAFALMSLLGASIMPHNFYLHSSVVQQHQGPTQVSKGALCHDHLFAVSCVFSGIFVVNNVLMNSAANVFFSTGLDLLTFQDALSLMDQVFRSLMAPFTLILVLLLSSHTTALTSKFVGQAVLRNFFKIDVPGWSHHSTIRFIAVIPALLCAWNSGAEGTYQLLIFTQITIALLLPSSVIPLFRVASSRNVMGVHKISQFTEFIVLISYIGMLGLAIVFVIEMVFGSSDWASNIRWSMPVSYIILLVIALFSLSLMLWLVLIPLKSASSRADPLKREFQEIVPVLGFEKRDGNDVSEDKFQDEDSRTKQETSLSLSHEKPLEYHSDSSRSSPGLDLPEVLLDADKGPHLTTIQEDSSDLTIPSPPTSQPEESAEKESSFILLRGDTDGELTDGCSLKNEQVESVEKTLRIDGNSCIVEDHEDHERDAWVPEESPKVVSGTNQSPTSDGPGSFRSLSGKNDDLGSGTGSPSKLGRAARRQLATTLDDFWKQLFDLHGEPTQEAKTRKLDKLLGIEAKGNTKASPAPLKVDTRSNEFTEYIPSVSGGVPDSLMSPSFSDSARQQSMQSSLESIYGAQRGPSSLLSSYSQLLEAYAQNPSLNVMDLGEKRYYSLRLPQALGAYDDQPATVHGYQMKSYINQTKQSSDYFLNQMDPLAPKTPSLVSSNYKTPFSATRTTQNGLRPAKPPGFPDPIVSRNNSMQPDRTYHNIRPAVPETIHSPLYEKKYYSMPDISGLSLPHRTSSLTNRDPKWDTPTRYGGALSVNPSYRSGASSGYNEFSYSNLSRDAAAYQRVSGTDTWSMWSKQPLEQFGVAEKANNGGDGVGARPNLHTREPPPAVDFEANLLKSLRLCILKLLKLEGSDWLFNQNGGLDEDLIDRVAGREKFLYDVESKEVSRAVHANLPGSKVEDAEYNKYLVTSVPNCSEDCVWRVDLLKSFGVWCIHRILDLSLMERRPELWGKYTFVLNRLQGIIEPAFSKSRVLMNPCFCLQLLESYQHRSSPPKSNRSLPPPVKHNRGKPTTASSLLDIVKDVEISISCRKGRTGTAAGDVAFPKGKENLASVLKRYKRRFSAEVPVAYPRTPVWCGGLRC